MTFAQVYTVLKILIIVLCQIFGFKLVWFYILNVACNKLGTERNTKLVWNSFVQKLILRWMEQTNNNGNSLILSSQNASINCTKIPLPGDKICIELRDNDYYLLKSNKQLGHFPFKFVWLRFPIKQILSFNEQIPPVTSDFVKSKFYCIRVKRLAQGHNASQGLNLRTYPSAFQCTND